MSLNPPCKNLFVISAVIILVSLNLHCKNLLVMGNVTVFREFESTSSINKNIFQSEALSQVCTPFTYINFVSTKYMLTNGNQGSLDFGHQTFHYPFLAKYSLITNYKL